MNREGKLVATAVLGDATNPSRPPHTLETYLWQECGHTRASSNQKIQDMWKQDRAMKKNGNIFLRSRDQEMTERVWSYRFLGYLILRYLILSYIILSYLILSYLVLSYMILSYVISSYIVLSYLILSYLLLSYLILSYEMWEHRTQICA